MNSRLKSLLSAGALIPLGLALSGCGKGNPLIRNVTLKNEIIQDEVHLAVKAELGLNLPELIPITLPIAHVGQIVVYRKNVSLSINASQALRLHSCDGKMPNGTAIPVAAPSGLQIACIPIGGSDSRVYVGFSGRQWLAGFALALKIPSPVNLPLNVMLPIPVKDPSIQAVGGTFFGPVSGLAVFAVKQDTGGTVGISAMDGDRSLSRGEFRLKADAITSQRKRALERTYFSTEGEAARVD